MNKTIFLLRHAQTDFNRNGIVQGSGVDSNINDWGKNQARAFFEKYKNEGFEVILTSKLKRTHDTVKPFLDLEIPWVQFDEINEISWGIHEGKASEPWMIEDYRRINKAWENGDYSAKIKEGESALELGNRLKKFVSVLKNRPEKKLLVCSHGRALRALVCLMKGWELKEMQHINHKNTGLYLAHYQNDVFEFVLENDRSHLPARNPNP